MLEIIFVVRDFKEFQKYARSSEKSEKIHFDQKQLFVLVVSASGGIGLFFREKNQRCQQLTG